MTIVDWDAAYSNRGTVKDADGIIEGWRAASVAYRTENPGLFDIPYGDTDRQIYDLFVPTHQKPKGLLVYIHGGYWLSFDKGHSSQCAAGPVERGLAVAIPSYDLCPHVSISEITAQIAKCVASAAERVDGPIVLTGHSAGGHLAAMLACEEGPLTASLRDRLVATVPLSGLFDLRPLMMTAMNDTLQITGVLARQQSPALLTPLSHVQHHVFCGADELAEFRRQSALLANIWSGLGVPVTATEIPGINHFTIPNLLADPHSEVSKRCADVLHIR